MTTFDAQMNLMLSLFILLVMLLVASRRFAKRQSPIRVKLLDVALLLAAVILVGGGAWTAGWIGDGPWLVIGTGGRAMLAALALLILLSRDDV